MANPAEELKQVAAINGDRNVIVQATGNGN
jgi:hypothetical protein